MERRRVGLDALRAAAAGLVFLYHLASYGVGFGPLGPVIGGANGGVTIFFVLSGYLLFKPFLGERRLDRRAYLVRRAARILPAYYVALVGLSLLTGKPDALEHPLMFLVLPAPYDGTILEVAAPAWTLHLEALFYLVLPVLASLVLLGGRQRLLANVGWLAVGLASLGFLVQPILVQVGYAFLLSSVVTGFLPGMLLAALEVSAERWFLRLADGRVALVGALIIAASFAIQGQSIEMGAGIGTFLLLPWCSRLELPRPAFWTFVAGASYAFYLWQYDLLGQLAGLHLPAPVFVLVGFVAAAVVSAASWVLVERPSLEWGKALSRRLEVPRVEVPVVAQPEAAVSR